jgi:phage-related protein
MAAIDKPLVWLHGEIKSPRLSSAARLETGLLLRKLQRGEKLGTPYSRFMPSIGPRCHELRINDERVTLRIVYRIDTDAIVLLEVFTKKTAQTPKPVIDNCKRRLKDYDSD